MMRVFLDANVLFTAAHNPGGKAAFVIELGAAGHFEVCTSRAAWREAERNLAARYPDCLQALASMMPGISVVSMDPSCAVPDSLPPQDAVIFQSAVSCRATHFLTGDLRHFGPMMNQPQKTSSVVVQTVAEFLARLSHA